MTDRDDSAESFLERWSRRKIEAGQDEARPDAPQGEVRTERNDESRPEQKSASPSAPAVKAEFDITKLPSLDSITAASDVRAFLAHGVPAELTRAALRRAWAADPAIRDFVGLAENSWDFTDPNAMAGFGDLPVDFDVKKAIAQLFPEPGTEAKTSPSPAREEPPRATAPEPDCADRNEKEAIPQKIDDAAAATDAIAERTESKSEFVRRDKYIALHQKRDGSTLPQ